MDFDLNTGTPPNEPALQRTTKRCPKIAGVIPAYNAAKVVTEAINSLLQQTIPVDEIIVVDDGSADDTAGVAERTGVRVIRQANGGPAAARNTAIRATDADWIVLLDADDVAYPDRVAIQLQHLDDPAVAVVCGNAPKGLGSEIAFEVLWERNQIITSTVALRRSAWEAVGGFEESRALIGVEDYHLWLRLSWSGWKLLRLEQPLSRYIETETSLTRQIDRCVKSEILNARQLGEEFQLSSEVVRAKEYAVWLQYGRNMFHDRDFNASRGYLSEAALLGRLSWPNRLRFLLSQFPALAKYLP